MAAVAWQETCAIAQASYRLMAQALLTNMVAAGFVQTSDTSQVTPSTIVVGTGSSPGAGTFPDDYGYLMFRMNDSLSSTLPVFIKIVFGAFFAASSGSVRRAAVKITIGFSTDGAGNFVGPTKEIISTGLSVPLTANVELPGPHSSWCHHKEGLAALFAYRACWQTANSTTCTMVHPLNWFVIERTRDSSGNPTGEGIYILSRGMVANGNAISGYTLAALNYSSQFTPQPHITFMSPGTTNMTKWGAIWLGENYTNSKDGAIQLQDIWAPHNGGTPFKSVKLYKAAGATVGDTTNLTQDGVTKPFILLGSWAFFSDFFLADSAAGTTAAQDVGLALEWAA